MARSRRIDQRPALRGVEQGVQLVVGDDRRWDFLELRVAHAGHHVVGLVLRGEATATTGGGSGSGRLRCRGDFSSMN